MKKQEMRKIIVLTGLAAILALAGAAFYWQQIRSRQRQQDLAAAMIDTRHGNELTESLAERYPDDAYVILLRTRALRMRNQVAEALKNLKRAEDLAGPRTSIERER